MADTASRPGLNGEKLQAAKAEEHEITRNARKGGASAYEFRADASPADKAAMIKETIPPGQDIEISKAKLKSALKATHTTAVVSDLDTGPPSVDTPSVTLNGNTNGAANATKNGDTTPKNDMVNGFPKAGNGEWCRTGWEPRFGSLNDVLDPNEDVAADHRTLLESNLDDKFFGEWWHNAGIIAFACLSTWFITKLGGGLVMVCIIGSICATYYRTSIRRVRRNARDDITRELAKTRLDSDLETLEWLNSFVVKFWPIYEPNLSAGIINTADGILANAAPGFLDSIRLPTFTLGTKPPRIDHVKTYPKTEDDIVEMDWSFSFTPNDTADLTSRQLKNKLNPKVVLEARVGKGIASKGIPIIVEDMAFSGTMKVKIKLQINFPHVEKVDVCFLGRPVFDYVLKPLGGDTFGFDIGFLPGLSGFIQEMIHGTLQPMFYSPNVFTLEVAKILGGAPIDTAIGVLVVTVHRAHGLSGSPDPYTVLSINQRAELARTKTIEGSSDPKWSETKYIVVSNLNDNLTLTVFDYNDIRKDKELGVVNFPLSVLQETPEHENQTLPIMFNGKPRGQMVFDIRFFPVLEGPVLADGKKGPPPESNTGILRYTVSQAKDLDASKSLIGHLTPYCQMTLNNRHVHTTKVIKRNNNPIWEESHEIFITNQKACKLGVIIKDERGFIDDPIIGKYQIKLPDLLDGNGKGTEWFNLTGVKSGRVKMTAQWKPVTVKGIAGTGGYVTPVGVVRLHFQNAKDLRNLEAVSKSDPYVRILLNGVQKSRTITVENNLNPEWDEVHYIPVHSEKEKLTLEVMDQETLGKDRSLGAYQLDLAELLQVDSQGLYQVHDEKKNRSAGLISDRKGTVRGTLNFTASFYPCLNVADPEDEEEKKLKELETEKGVQNVKPRALGEGMAAEDDNMKELEILRSPISPAFTISSEADVSEKGPPKIKLTPEDLVKYESGLIIFRIIEGQLAHADCHLEVLMDDMLFPTFSSPKIRSKNIRFDEFGDAMVRELEFSEVTLRLRDHGEEGEGAVRTKLSGSTLETLKQCLNNPTVLTLKNKNGEASRVKVSLKYIPVLMKLDPSESISNMGTLRVEILDAANLLAMDRNGKSDPFCIFELEGKEVFKSKVQKKTLHPSWNEHFETKIVSRTAANFVVEVHDWDMASKSDFLGKTRIDLTVLTPFTPQTIQYKLKSKKGQEGNFGELRLRLGFKPDYVTRSRQSSSTFSGTFAAPGKLVAGVAGAPLKVGGLAVGGVSKGASFLKKNTFGRKSKDSGTGTFEEEANDEMTTAAPVPTPPASASARPVSRGSAIRTSDGTEDLQRNGRSSLSPSSAGGENVHVRSRSLSSQHSVTGVLGAGPESGTATVRLVSATGFPAGANVQVRIRAVDKNKDLLKSKSVKSSSGEIHWDESFTCQCFADQQFKVFVKDNHIFKDEELGEGLFVVDDTGSGHDTVINVGEGKLTLKTSFHISDSGVETSPKASRRGLLKRG